MATIRLTLAQAIVRYLAALRIGAEDKTLEPYCAGVFAIFGHGNVAGLGEALWQERERLPTYRAHNEQAMAHSAIAFSKAHFRRKIMAVTTSIGPGATNLLTAAALAHVNRLPVLFLPGDVFASRAPDPVLQQLEDFSQGDISVNDAFRPLTRYFDRIMRPEQIFEALPRAIQIMTDPGLCGPVCLALPQDVQAQAFDMPEAFLNPEPLYIRAAEPDSHELHQAAALLGQAKRVMIIAGGGALYSGAGQALADFAARFGIPVGETQAGKGALAWDHPFNAGAIGVTGSPSANELAQGADVILAIGTRLQDFTTGSHSLFAQAQILGLNVNALDAAKWRARALVCDAQKGLLALGKQLGGWRTDARWSDHAQQLARRWRDRVAEITCADPGDALPYEGEIIGAVRDSAPHSDKDDIVVGAAGTLPAELHKLWRTAFAGGYHMEYGFSCMGYEIAAGLGVKLAQPEKHVIVMVGDGSYLMLNSEIATSILLGLKLIIVVLDNRGYGCIQRLQLACGGAQFNNLLPDCATGQGEDIPVDFVAHARSLGAHASFTENLAEFGEAMQQARAARRTHVIVIATSPWRTTGDGGHWWEVAVPEVSGRAQNAPAYAAYAEGKSTQRIV